MTYLTPLPCDKLLLLPRTETFSIPVYLPIRLYGSFGSSSGGPSPAPLITMVVVLHSIARAINIIWLWGGRDLICPCVEGWILPIAMPPYDFWGMRGYSTVWWNHILFSHKHQALIMKVNQQSIASSITRYAKIPPPVIVVSYSSRCCWALGSSPANIYWPCEKISSFGLHLYRKNGDKMLLLRSLCMTHHSC